MTVVNSTDRVVHSVRVNGRCLWFNPQVAGNAYYFPNITMGSLDNLSVIGYAGWKCESNTAYFHVNWAGETFHDSSKLTLAAVIDSRGVTA
jgi:hypothetical protein